MVDLNKGELQTTHPKCSECGMIHPKHPSGRCPIKYPEIIQTTEKPTEIKEFLTILGLHLENSERPIEIMEGIVKLLNLQKKEK